jgi:hypothetical protein
MLVLLSSPLFGIIIDLAGMLHLQVAMDDGSLMADS